MSELNTLATIMIILCIMHFYYFVRGLMKHRKECQCEWLKIKLEAEEKMVKMLTEQQWEMVNRMAKLGENDSLIIQTMHGCFYVSRQRQEATS